MIRIDSRRGSGALMVAHCAGMVDLVALPVWIGTLVARYGFDPQQAGGLATLFLFGAVAAGSLLQWTVSGAVLLTVLFIGSTRFTEEITRSKYPEYADYQATTSAIVPWPPRRKESTVTA